MKPRILLFLLLVVPACFAAAAAPPDAPWGHSDAYLKGYIEAWLRYAHAIPPGQIEVNVDDGKVTLTGKVETSRLSESIAKDIGNFEGVTEVANGLTVSQKAYPRWRSWSEWDEYQPGRRWVFFPRGDVFLPPLADQKQPRFHTSWQRIRTDFGKFTIASVGFGENFGLVRWRGRREGDGVQLGLSGAVFAIFDVHAASKDLLNADYIVGFPLSIRHGVWSARARIYHLSSHLGDEFLLFPQRLQVGSRINLSYEELELLASWEWKGLRAYGGRSRIFSSETPLGRERYQGGAEYRGAPGGWRRAQLMAGIDVQSWEQTRWDKDFGGKAGIMFNSPYKETRSFQIFVEYYNGHFPHGQFYSLDAKYWGAGVAFSY